MKIRLDGGLPFVAATLTFWGQRLTLDNVLIDTGSLGSIFPADRVAEIGLEMEAQDSIYRIRGVGGSEFVFAKQVHALEIGDLTASDFEIEIGAMEYGFDIDGIIGMDFLLQVGAILDLGQLEVSGASPGPQ
jgi:hypothetical protein